ncbi:MAG: hypothetical protein M3Y17_16200 [Actinomycetota bacterium]|nr:hypothetical protein [Actinomycetota bacterium]
MSGYRSEIEASAGPAREGLIGGGMRLLVRVRLFEDPSPEYPLAPDAFTDLRPETARELAFELLAAAEDAERQTLEAGFWETSR